MCRRSRLRSFGERARSVESVVAKHFQFEDNAVNGPPCRTVPRYLPMTAEDILWITVGTTTIRQQRADHSTLYFQFHQLHICCAGSLAS